MTAPIRPGCLAGRPGAPRRNHGYRWIDVKGGTMMKGCNDPRKNLTMNGSAVRNIHHMSQPTCTTCPAWVHIDGGEGLEDEGECHGGLPQLVQGEGLGILSPYKSAWPPVAGGDFCAFHPAWNAWLTYRAQGLA
jgi:hypothetical protein